ncbi:MAG: hypothetical protein C4324_10620 [Blastocatellia bacterium]
MGNEYRREDSSVSTKLTYLLIGGGIGAIIALLFAPKSGQELREDIADATRKGLEKGRETAAHLQEKAGEYYEKSRRADLHGTGKGGRIGRKGKNGCSYNGASVYRCRRSRERSLYCGKTANRGKIDR